MLKLAGLILALTLALLLPAAETAAPRRRRTHRLGKLDRRQRGEQSLLAAAGARNYMNYCVTCHSLKYLRYSRMAEDLRIPADQLQKHLMPIEAKPADYIMTSLSDADAEAWFGKAPPDLSLMARARHGGVDYIYRYLKTFYTDTTRATRTSNLVLEGTPCRRCCRIWVACRKPCIATWKRLSMARPSPRRNSRTSKPRLPAG
jgi:ubiquinol-cytochrome c reductase cytochrome c1 subunit